MTPTPIASLVPRQRAVVRGRIVAVTSHQWPAISSKVELQDGSGAVTLRLLGRSNISGLAIGRWLSAEGTPAEAHGRLVMLSPRYSLVPGPCG